MSTVRAYRVCDICGNKLDAGIEKLDYRIEPKSPIKMKVWGYLCGAPHAKCWSYGIDMCSHCWRQMVNWINANKKAGEE